MKFIDPGRHHDKPSDPDFFVIKCASGMAAARHWLKPRIYNTFTHFIDRHGSLSLSLIFDFDKGTFPSKRRHKRGIICISNQVYEKSAIALILSHMQGHIDPRTHALVERLKGERRPHEGVLSGVSGSGRSVPRGGGRIG